MGGFNVKGSIDAYSVTHTYARTHTHTHVNTVTVIHKRRHVVFLQGLIFTAVTHGDVRATDGSLTYLRLCCCSLK